MSKNEEVKKGVIFPIGDENTAYAQYFIGQSYYNALVADPEVAVGVGNVTFEPGCRNNWHIHHDGYQILLVTGGEGWYQEYGKPAQSLKPGDVIVTHDGVKHWHGPPRTAGSSTSPSPPENRNGWNPLLMSCMRVCITNCTKKNVQPHFQGWTFFFDCIALVKKISGSCQSEEILFFTLQLRRGCCPREDTIQNRPQLLRSGPRRRSQPNMLSELRRSLRSPKENDQVPCPPVSHHSPSNQSSTI